MYVTFITISAVIVAVGIIIFDNIRAQKMVNDITSIYESMLSNRKLENRRLRDACAKLNKEKNELLEKIKSYQTFADIGEVEDKLTTDELTEFLTVPKIRAPKNGPKFGEF